MRKAVFLVVLSIALGFTFSAQAADVSRIEITEYGVFTIERKDKVSESAQGIALHKVINTKLKETTDTVKAEPGLTFGIRYDVMGNPKDQRVELTMKWIHPVMQRPGYEAANEHSYKSKRTIGSWGFNCYTFDHPWEMVPGDWTIRIIYQGKVMAQKTFHVRKP